MTSLQARAIAAARQHDLQQRPAGTSEAALTGATSAFHRPDVKPKPAPKPRQLTSTSSPCPAHAPESESRPALSRKSSLSSRRSVEAIPVSSHSTGNNSYTGNGSGGHHEDALKAVHLPAPSAAGPALFARSPSSIAANLAAARLSPRPQIKTQHAPLKSNSKDNGQPPESAAVRKVRARRASIDWRTGETSLDGIFGNNYNSPRKADTTSIPPTESLVNMFEQPGTRPPSIRRVSGPASETQKSAHKPLSNEIGLGPQESAAARKLRARQASISRRWTSNLQDDRVRDARSTGPTDTSSIAPTKSLVQTFEQTLQKSPKAEQPQSASGLGRGAITREKSQGAQLGPQSKFTTDPIKPNVAPKPSNYCTPNKAAESAESVNQYSRSSEETTPLGSFNNGISSDSTAYASVPGTGTKPTPPLSRRGRSTKPQPASSFSPPSSASIEIRSTKPSYMASTQNRRTLSTTSISPSPPSLGPRPPFLQPNNYSQTSIKRISPHMSGSNIADAIVAASLSSRTPSPNPRPGEPLPPPLLPPRMEPRHHHLPFTNRRTRTVSPPKKAMRTTMREDPSSTDSSDDNTNPHKRHRHRLVRKHPHKHHEGDRLRWRSTITESERKRYEGIFASNKGLLLSSRSRPAATQGPKEADEVHGLIVRDIWSRSRLSQDCLREIWDLVAGQDGAMVGLEGQAQRGCLRREEFVVGMWLIDQRLKGRKLPIKVGESVWGSVRGVGGLVVPKARQK